MFTFCLFNLYHYFLFSSFFFFFLVFSFFFFFFFWYAIQRRRPAAAPTASNRDVNLDIGEIIHVEAWNPDGTATVRYRGAQWTVVPRSGQAPTTGEHRVVEVVGSRLVVDKT